MSLLTVAELEQHVEAGLGDPALQRVLDDVESEIIRRFGAHFTQTDEFYGGFKLIFLSRVASSVTTVVETDSGDGDTTIAADDYDVKYDGRALFRRNDGTNSRSTWDTRVKVTYVPVGDLAQRERVQIDLCKLALAYTGLESSRSGNYTESHVDYEKEREQVLQRLAPRHKLVL